jgi:hypothetical protein
MKRRVVVTGIGCVTPIGISYEQVKDSMMHGYSGIKYYEKDRANLGRVEFDVDSQIAPLDQTITDRISRFAWYSYLRCKEDAKITKEQVAAGDFKSPNLDASTSGLWGGLIVLGKAPISASSNEVQIEGIPTTDPNGLYGGTDNMDNSGIIRYVSIRHGGANIGNGNEINGLTLGGVGAGTTIEYIEVIGNQDDGVEWFRKFSCSRRTIKMIRLLNLGNLNLSNLPLAP